MEVNYIYEVETRFAFKDKDEVYKTLPFLKSYLNTEVLWETFHYGLELYKKDKVLRISYAKIAEKGIISLAYKERDTGEILNIRKEYGEKIKNGIENSYIMNVLGGNSSLKSPIEVKNELERLGYKKFMSFQGKSIIGKYNPLDMHFKLMFCDSLEYPLMLEVEKEAFREEQISSRESDILNFIEKYNLENRIVEKEPPTLLYEALFGNK